MGVGGVRGRTYRTLLELSNRHFTTSALKLRHILRVLSFFFLLFFPKKKGPLCLGIFFIFLLLLYIIGCQKFTFYLVIKMLQDFYLEQLTYRILKKVCFHNQIWTLGNAWTENFKFAPISQQFYIFGALPNVKGLFQNQISFKVIYNYCLDFFLRTAANESEILAGRGIIWRYYRLGGQL